MGKPTEAFGKIDATGICWEWTGVVDAYGYGRSGGLLAHRYVYRLLTGVDLSGLELHHMCENSVCVNPDHLRPITRVEHNAMKRRSFCSRGHRRSGDRCKPCDALRQRKYAARKRLMEVTS